MTDAEFEAAVGKVTAGDKTGLRDLYDAYADTIYRLFLGKVHNHQDAEDLTSDFFLKLWECAAGYRPGRGHRCWMMTIARNMAIDYLRKAGHTIPVEDAETVSPAALTETKTAADTVTEHMQTEGILSVLPEDEQEIVRMHIAAELTFREIAAILKRPLGTISWKYRNAIGKLQKLAEEGSLL